MARAHRIHEQTIELRTRDEGLAQRLLERVSALHRRELVAILDRVCTDASPHLGPTHRLERLELDLGSIDPENFELEFRRAFETTLRRALTQAIADADAEVDADLDSGDGGPASVRAPGALLELVELFATSGVLPWWADGRRADLVDRAVDTLVRSSPVPLRRLVVRLGTRPRTLARLVQALDQPTRAALLECALPSMGERMARQLARVDGRADACTRCELWTAALVSAALAVKGRPGSSVDERFAVELLERAPTGTGGWTREELARVLELPLPQSSDRSTRVRADRSEQGRAAKPDISNEAHRATAEPVEPVEPSSSGDIVDVDRASASVRSNRPELPEHPTPRRTPPRPRPPRLPTSLDAIPIDDAGLVLLWPFIPHLLRRLELTVDDAFVDARAQTQAVALLEHCARARVELAEHQLVLDKLLCGLDPDDVLAPLDVDRHAAPAMLAEADRMLEAVIAHAEILRDMSIDNLRATFVRREGLLKVREGRWLLQVESLTHDIVLERLPWSFAWVKLPWMPDPLEVEWA